MLRARYRRVVLFFARALLSLVFWELFLPRVGFRRWVQRTRSERLSHIAVSFRELAIQMGGVLIKLGQFLSARMDVLPPEIVAELTGLQDAVPADDFADIRQLLETELEAPIAERFVAFDKVPLAAASLGQAHQARIRVSQPGSASAVENGDNGTGDLVTGVVVKIQRPNIGVLIDTDLAALRTVGKWLQRYPPIRKRADVPTLLEEFSRTLYEEIDYLAEGRNAETFAANFKERAGIHIPRVLWEHTTRRVITLEDATGIKITDYAAITRAGVDRAEVAGRLFDIYMKQVFEDGFFHADPHPGNLFVSVGGQSEGWKLTFVDFGMVGHIPSKLNAGLQEALIALATRDAARLVKSFQMLGMLLPQADLALTEQAMSQTFEHIWGRSMTELQMSHEEMWKMTHEFRDLLYTMPFQIPQDLIMLGRTMAILSGMATGLDPHFNVWEGILPYAQVLISGESGGVGKTILEELKWLGSALLALPRRADALLGKLERGELAIQTPQIAGQLDRMERSIHRLTVALIFAMLCVSGTQLILAGHDILGKILLAGTGIILIWMMLSGKQ